VTVMDVTARLGLTRLSIKAAQEQTRP
jgi:hypothetical protein